MGAMESRLLEKIDANKVLSEQAQNRSSEAMKYSRVIREKSSIMEKSLQQIRSSIDHNELIELPALKENIASLKDRQDACWQTVHENQKTLHDEQE